MTSQIRWHTETNISVAEQAAEGYYLINLAFDIGESLPLDDRDREIDLSQQSRIEARLIELPDPPPDINTELQIIHQQHQSQLEMIDTKILEIKQLKFRTQQLARHSKNQLEQAVETLSSIEQIRTEIVSVSLNMDTKFTDLDRLSIQITNTHTQIVETAQTMQAGMRDLDRRFKELSVSIQTEKEQFYELTAETIEKADLIQSQLIEIVKQIGDDRQQHAIFRNEIELVRSTTKTEVDRQLNDFEMRQNQLISISNNFQVRQKHQIIAAKKISRWLWILSVAVIGILILLLRILFTKS